jgi:hypothetical protein
MNKMNKKTTEKKQPAEKKRAPNNNNKKRPEPEEILEDLHGDKRQKKNEIEGMYIFEYAIYAVP